MFYRFMEQDNIDRRRLVYMLSPSAPSRLQREGLSISICDALKREDIYTIGFL